VARGGGVLIPPSADFGPGATVTIVDSVIAGNRAAPTSTLLPEPGQEDGWPKCPTGFCPYAGAEGGGIDNWGALSVTRSAIIGNVVAGSVTSDADGGGIWSAGAASLALRDSAVSANRAVAVAPNGRFAEGGGLFVDGGSLSMRDTDVSGNLATLTSDLPGFADGQLIDLQAHAGGIQVGNGVPTTLDDVRITGNTAVASDPAGQPIGFDAGLLVNDSPLTMRRSLVAGNRSIAVVGTSTDAGPGGSAVEADGGGTIESTRIVGNIAAESSADGLASVNGALAVLNFADHDPLPLTVRTSVIAGNLTRASSRTGSATAQGGGVFNNALLTLDRVQVSDNVVVGAAPSGAAEGGGIWNGVELSGPPVELTVTKSSITGNLLAPSPGIDRRGGGVFTSTPASFANTLIARNVPDQCFGCAATAAAAVRARHPRRTASESGRRAAAAWRGRTPAAGRSPAAP
jgi:hypothetical protein